MRRGFDQDAFGFGRSWGWGPWGGRRRRQWFGSGDMKYVILKLLQEKPRHGYEVMKELEERMGGCYTPSPGTVYPTLQWLEDEGLVTVRELEGKKIYEITPAGVQFLETHRDVVEDIFDRIREVVERVSGGAMADVNRAVGRLLKAAYRTGWKLTDDAARRRVAEVLTHAAEELETMHAAT
jgi:DNA-binding PadR family transcriptional regulator